MKPKTIIELNCSSIIPINDSSKVYYIIIEISLIY